ncbi:methyltransferase domain-containing protein [Mycetocola manganoxydans]|uniref:Methyltransferase domain-containing protein n=1 Tax=Mycetocola manganoxydans TaxID=699879 RepID=A0A3L6ZQN2_9MICO|nr:methyltransferase [Mycetocola manganoxydans]RLP70216.1 methyltransferase domain-containing protein [Mycetocola manganoxydans]GHD49315.1 methyltransferase [Mycetocola manganoxydans]
MTSELVQRLRSDLDSARFTVTTITGLWGDEADAALHRNERIPALRALAARREENEVEAAATLARLFVLGLPVPADELAAALPTLTTEGALALKLVALDEGQVTPLLDLRPYSFVDANGAGSWWVVSDLGELALGRPIGEDHVLGVGGASMTLSGLMMQTPVGTVLDLGTGCGIQAMHAARHAASVVATDISERALVLARLNAELNGIHNIEFRHGDLFEPVRGERFDQIVSNPPFVITPRTEGVPAYEYRDGGMEGDALVEAVIRGAAAHLHPGGVAQLLGNWEYRVGQDAFRRVGGWIDGTGLDAWVIERDVQDPAEYAETWIRDGGTRSGTPEFDRLYAAWLDDFAARRVTSVGFGYVTLRMPLAGDPSLRRLERMHGSLGANESGLGVHLESVLAGRDWQAALSDEDLALAHVSVAADVTEERHYWPGAEHPTAMMLRQGGGLGRTVRMDTGLAALVGACDGDLPISAVVAAIAQLLDADYQELLAELLPRVRALIDDGFLLPPEQ